MAREKQINASARAKVSHRAWRWGIENEGLAAGQTGEKREIAKQTQLSTEESTT
jgi:hypothetical protein